MSANDWDWKRDTDGYSYIQNGDMILRFIIDAYGHDATIPEMAEAWEQMYWGVEKSVFDPNNPKSHMACSHSEGGSEIGFTFDLPYDEEYNKNWKEENEIPDDINIVTVVHAWIGTIREEYIESIKRYIREGGREWYL